VPVVVSDMMHKPAINAGDLEVIGYRYSAELDKWNIGDAAADYLYTGNKILDFNLPGTLKVLVDHATWLSAPDQTKYHPVLRLEEYTASVERSSILNFICFDVSRTNEWERILNLLAADATLIACLESRKRPSMMFVRRFIMEMMQRGIQSPVIICVETSVLSIDEQLIHFSTEAGALFLEGMGDGIWLWNNMKDLPDMRVSGRTYLEVRNNDQFLNNTAFSILQATRTRISKTEYISCPSCGRTLFDLQETTAKIRSFTHHLKGVKIAIMGCIVNGPGEMADADFGYVGSGPGKITLYKGKEIVKRNVDSEIAVSELIELLKENSAWIDPQS
jgi:(E)-4-hydroxy-3-methylbut-2-enyl-diphosphate synthase